MVVDGGPAQLALDVRRRKFAREQRRQFLRLLAGGLFHEMSFTTQRTGNLMIAVIQKVKKAHVTVKGAVVGEIGVGLTALVAIHADDSAFDIQWMAQKLATIRVFPGGDKYFDQDVQAIGGGILLVSNFTVAADTQSGRRPSLSPAASPAVAAPLFEQLLAAVKSLGIPTGTGQFGASMEVTLTNDGPVTFILDSRPSRPKAAAI
jgi:D-tyrosyl-tRNA(Tyr) deacylase